MFSKNGHIMTDLKDSVDSAALWQDLYMKGDDLQKLSVIQALPDLLQTDNNATISRIIPKIQQELPNSSSEFHLVTSKIFKLLIEMKLNLNLMRPVLQGIESKDPIVSNAWIETLLAVIHCLAEPPLKNDVLPFATKMSQLNRAVFFRVNSCKILGQVAIHPKFSSYEVKKDILPLVQSLCQDCLHEVRSAMCTELPNIAKGLASDTVVKSSLLPCLVELSSDENMHVRAAAVDAVALLIPYMNSDTIRTTAIPLVKQLCIQCNREGDQTYPSVAKIYGNLLTNLGNNLSQTESLWFLDNFRNLSMRGLSLTNVDLDTDPSLAVTCRNYCAYNLPAVTFFTMNHLQTELGKWYMIFKDLAGDPCYIVRKTVAGCIHEITRILDKESKLIVIDIVKLLRDDAEEVLDVLVPNIGNTLELLASTGILSREQTSQTTLEIGRALLKCQVEIFRYYNWRRKMEFLKQLEQLPICVSADFIHQHFAPLVLKLTVEARSKPVRTQAARTMLIFLRYSAKENHRKWIRENLLNILCNSTSCYTRHIFINMCVHAMEIFSWKYFKEYFYLPLLGLGDDPVSTVRLCVVNLCPMLKQMLVLPIDRNLQLKLENFMSKIEMMEKDKDVLSSLKTKLKEMRTPQINKQETLMEEKRKVEEEDKILQGKLSLHTAIGTHTGTSIRSVKDTPRVNLTAQTKPTYRRRSITSTSSNEMSFLDHHFYVDAGVALPDNSEGSSVERSKSSIENSMSHLTIERKMYVKEENTSEVSVENTNVENMSDEDLIEREISTTNITDDEKANIQKISSSESVTKSKLPVESVKKRNKRYSCVLTADLSSFKNSEKRRSLNIGGGEVSKIPVCFKTGKKIEEKSNMRRSKSSSVQSIYSRSRVELLSSSSAPKLTSDIQQRGMNIEKKSNFRGTRLYNISGDNMGNLESISRAEVKENVPIDDSIKTTISKHNKGSTPAKVSNLPVLKRRSVQSNLK
ncbi:serine/threonine-protein phosphatase 4 regulatory subunit 4 isoform X2 [Leptinotarsa decemlineata]|uniref:serine/threonine-protein phosphatase 4 regulatory subunit 4 isoform X2 n=1 Tax=Leptinotarsa decemlineata TaxID=7539 RepID=UPI003D30AB01